MSYLSAGLCSFRGRFSMIVERVREANLIGLCALLAGAQPGAIHATELPPTAQPGVRSPTTPSLHADRPDEWSVTILGGWLNEANFSGILISPWTSSFNDTQMISGAISKRIYELGKESLLGQYWFVDFEVGVGQRFGNSGATELWSALYLRYDGFPWPEKLYITTGVSTGVNYASSIDDLEVSKSGNDKGNELLHYFSPEVTLADPYHKDLEFVARLHHRSGVFGLFNGVSGGSTFLSLGFRQHF